MAPTTLLLIAVVAAEPTPVFPIGKETTFVTGPIDAEGYIDYAAALNKIISKGITPETNANVLIWKALGPRPEAGKPMPAEFFKRLGIERPPEDGQYLVSLEAFLMKHVTAQEERNAIDKRAHEAMKRPWTAREIPLLAAWLKANEKPLALLQEATRRPHYYHPFVAEANTLLNVQISGLMKCRQLANALAARAMLRLGEKKFDEAWQDLLSCHRLARLVSRGATLIEGLVGIALDQVASSAGLAYLEHAPLDVRQVKQHLKDLRALPPLAACADKIDLGERFLYLDGLQLIRRGKVSLVRGLAGREEKPSPEELKALAAMDWEPALRAGNRWFDRLVAALRIEDRARREATLDQLVTDVQKLKIDGLEKLMEESS
ncbi:MAG: hypothetical protein WEH44_01985, partial [Pirellulaceae bacterium]